MAGVWVAEPLIALTLGEPQPSARSAEPRRNLAKLKDGRSFFWFEAEQVARGLELPLDLLLEENHIGRLAVRVLGLPQSPAAIAIEFACLGTTYSITAIAADA